MKDFFKGVSMKNFNLGKISDWALKAGIGGTGSLLDKALKKVNSHLLQ